MNPLQEAVEKLGHLVGDAAPASSMAQARLLALQHGLDDASAARLLSTAYAQMCEARPAIRRRGANGEPLGMPYLLATATSLVQRQASVRPVGRASHGPAAAQPDPVSVAIQAEPGTPVQRDEPPLWQAVRQELAGTLAPAVFNARIRPLQARYDQRECLVLLAPTKEQRDWLCQRLLPRLQEALAAVGAHQVRLTIETAPAGGHSGPINLLTVGPLHSAGS